MAKGEFTFKNKYGCTTEEVKGSVVTGDIPYFVGTLTHADDNYLYGTFNHNGNENIMLEFNVPLELIKE